VDKFGEGVFDIIEKESARLEDVDGIGPKRRKRIKDAWYEQKVIRNIMLFLHSNGVPLATTKLPSALTHHNCYRVGTVASIECYPKKATHEYCQQNGPERDCRSPASTLWAGCGF
jgi:hypothetical protein